MRKHDIIAGLIIGELCAWLALAIFRNVRVEFIFIWALPFLLPVLTIIGLFIANVLGRRFPILWQAAKFALVGVLNTLIDLGVLNMLIFMSGLAFGWGFSLFKGISFTVAVINSYWWNKLWTFKGSGREKVQVEFFQFFIVSAIGFGINVGTASAVVNFIGPQFGLSLELWANVGAIAAAFTGLTWNFLGYKFIVFKKRDINEQSRSLS